MEKIQGKVKRLQLAVMALVALNLFIILSAFVKREEKFDEISVDRINIVDKKGVTKMVIAANDRIRQDSNDESVKKDEFPSSGMLFRNEEGEECGGLIFRGKKSADGQVADAVLTFDQYNQDQNVVLEHKENVAPTESVIEDGLLVIQRPNYTKVEPEYQMYDKIGKMELSQAQKDSLRSFYAYQDVVSARRLFIGTKRGLKEGKPYSETGLFIKDRGGNNRIRIFVDYDNKPHFEVLGKDGKSKVYDLDLKVRK
jgi:hypothetical protein